MRNKITVSVLSTLCLLVAAGPAVAGQRPNIILIMADDLGYAGLSCYDNTYGIKTPHLDHMADNGLKFTDFHSNGAVCSPTRAALMTGRYQQRTGITGVVTAAACRNQGLALSETTLAEVLKPGGYRTAMFGKWHVGYSPKFNPVNQGFDEFIGFVSGNVDYQSHLDQVQMEDWWKQDQLVPEEGYQTTLVGNHGVDFIDRNAGQPFFLYLAFGAPHYPIQGPNDPPVRGKDAVRVKNFDVERAHREMIESMDMEIGRIKAKVDELGLTQNTLIFFCSDNGHARGAKWSADPRLRGSKGSVFEGGNRVPGIAYWPGSIRPGVTTETTMTMDLLPTCAALCSAPLPPDTTLDGIDLSTLLLEGTPLPGRSLFWHHGPDGALRRGPWKYVKASGGKETLYNLEEELSEKKDLSEKHPEKFRDLKKQYKEWLRAVSASPTGPEIDPDASPTPPPRIDPVETE
jgi:arylsulfatase A